MGYAESRTALDKKLHQVTFPGFGCGLQGRSVSSTTYVNVCTFIQSKCMIDLESNNSRLPGHSCILHAMAD